MTFDKNWEQIEEILLVIYSREYIFYIFYIFNYNLNDKQIKDHLEFAVGISQFSSILLWGGWWWWVERERNFLQVENSFTYSEILSPLHPPRPTLE